MTDAMWEMLTDLADVLAEADQYGYSHHAAYRAAAARLFDLPQGELVALAAALAALTVTQMQPRAGGDLRCWIEGFGAAVALQRGSDEQES